MSKKESILYIDPLSNFTVKVSSNDFKPIESFKKGYFIGSRIDTQTIFTHTFKAPSSSSDEELSSMAEIEMYENAGLNLEKQYQIDFVKKEIDYEDSYIIECFAIDKEKTKEYIGPTLKKCGHIDFLANPIFAFSSLYENDILTPKNDIFIYIGKNEAFLSIYQKGKYIAFSHLKSLEACIKSADIQIEDFIELLTNKGLDKEQYSKDDIQMYDMIEKYFTDIITRVNNVAMHNRSLFGFDSIERIFFSIEDGEVKNIKEFIVNIGLNETEVNDFNFFKQKQQKHLLEIAVSYYIYNKFIKKDTSNNLTLFFRKPPIYKTEVGKFILFSLFVALLSSIYPIYLHTVIQKKQSTLKKLQNKFNKLQKRSDTLKTEIKKTEKEIKKSEKIQFMKKTEVKRLTKGIDDIFKIKQSDTKDSLTILKINKYLKKYRLKLQFLERDENKEITLRLIVKNNKRDNIAKFMRDLLSDKFKKVSSKEINLNSDLYITDITIKP